MKKLGFGSRLLAILLVLTMVMSYIPTSVLAAAVVGDTKSDKSDVGLVAGSLDTTDTIRWPIKVYDYLNDGMLFEYSYAGDTAITEYDGGAYGGGQAMPMIAGDNIVGIDYTSINGYYNTVYRSDWYTTVLQGVKYGFENWGADKAYANPLDTSDEVERSIGQPVKDVDPMHLHLEYLHNTGDASKSCGWISNFAKDDTRYYTKDELRYMVMVYRTNDAYEANGGANGRTMKAYWAVSDSAHSSGYDISTGKTYVSANVDVLPSEDWTYVILDMNSNTAADNGIAKNWSSISGQRIAGVGMGLPLCGTGEEMDISHIAYFPTEELASYFGEKCVMFDEDPGEYMGRKITIQSKTGGVSAPTMTSGTQSMNFAANGTSGGNSAFKTWTGSAGMTVTGHKGD
ncbi:MAG: hypothetical protein II290_08595, partial [Oscillospiraceae bacterium]|nr:hypothetical protein [Oscillospiraceae bacterium]